jgi:putative ABC transport system permease protein
MNVWNTLRIAVRTWRRTPALATLIVLTLAVCIGGITTTFTIAYSTLVQRFPFPQPERLVWITTYDTRASDANVAAIASNRLPQFADWQHHLKSFDQIGAWAGRAPDVFTVTGTGRPERVNGLRVTHQLLSMLGATPRIGRLFATGDDVPGSAQSVVLSYGYWQRRFGGRADIIGQTITVENEPHAILGVVSPEFPLSASLFAGASIDLYLPLVVDGNADIGGFMAVIGRLRPGVGAEQTRAELEIRREALAVGKWQWMSVLAQRVSPLQDLVTRDARRPVLLLCAATGCVLLIACANVANLLLMRASGRRREVQVRMALGASMRQVFGEMVAESAILVALGGSAGLALAATITQVLGRVTWLTLARRGELQIGWAAIAFAGALCAVITCVFGGVALLHLRRRDAIDELRSHGVTTNPRAVFVQRLALVTQVAIVLILTVASGLLLRSLTELLRVDPGFTAHGVAAIRVDPAGRLTGPARLPFFSEVLDRVRAVPGVEAVALTIHLPMGDRPSMGWDAIPEGRTDKPDPVSDNAAGRIVSPGYFRSVGIPTIAGRDFDARDRRPNPFVMAVNETFARQIRSQGREPLGARFLVLGNVREVVSVVGDVKHQGLDRETGREVYIPMAQAPTFFQAYDLVVRAADPLALLPAIRTAIWDLDPNQALGTAVTLDEYLGRSLQSRRLLAALLTVFAASVLLLTTFGVYGVVGYRIGQQRKEIAIRVALGAPGWRVATTVMTDTALSVGLGFVVGLPLALAAAAALRNQLFGVNPDDAATLVSASAVVVAAAMCAAYVPSRRAARVDPIAALRVD